MMVSINATVDAVEAFRLLSYATATVKLMNSPFFMNVLPRKGLIVERIDLGPTNSLHCCLPLTLQSYADNTTDLRELCFEIPCKGTPSATDSSTSAPRDIVAAFVETTKKRITEMHLGNVMVLFLQLEMDTDTRKGSLYLKGDILNSARALVEEGVLSQAVSVVLSEEKTALPSEFKEYSENFNVYYRQPTKDTCDACLLLSVPRMHVYWSMVSPGDAQEVQIVRKGVDPKSPKNEIVANQGEKIMPAARRAAKAIAAETTTPSAATAAPVTAPVAAAPAAVPPPVPQPVAPPPAPLPVTQPVAAATPAPAPETKQVENTVDASPTTESQPAQPPAEGGKVRRTKEQKRTDDVIMAVTILRHELDTTDLPEQGRVRLNEFVQEVVRREAAKSKQVVTVEDAVEQALNQASGVRESLLAVREMTKTLVTEDQVKVKVKELLKQRLAEL